MNIYYTQKEKKIMKIAIQFWLTLSTLFTVIAILAGWIVGHRHNGGKRS